MPIVSGGLSKSNTVNNMKLMILAKIRVIRICVSTRIRKIPVQEIFREMAPIPGNVRTYPKVCVGKLLEYR